MKFEWQNYLPSRYRDSELKRHSPRLKTASGAKLLSAENPPVRYVVPGILCEGLSLLVGKPKLGKSWALLDWTVAVATGSLAFGSIPCEQGEALYLALEDNARRLQDRLKAMNAPESEACSFAIECPRADEGGVEAITAWLDKHPAARLVGIDTLARFRASTESTNAYKADTLALSELQRLAQDRRVAIVVVHHDRKAEAGDWIDKVSGTLGLTGVADATLLMERERGREEAFLRGTGRDLPDFEVPLKFDSEAHIWRKLGASVAEIKATSGQRELVELLRAHPGLSAPELVKASGAPKGTVYRRLDRLEDEGLVTKRGTAWFPVSEFEPQ
jgi:hypothetical protein